MAISEKALRSIKSQKELIAFLANELNWPVDPTKLDASTFAYTPEELGVSPKDAAAFNSIKSLRPQSPSQPWGIWLLGLEDSELSSRRIKDVLEGLSTKRRASKQAGMWRKENLLFIVSNGTKENLLINLIVFKEEPNKKPSLLTIDWRPAFVGKPRALRLVNEILPQLKWPEEPDNHKEWKQKWTAPFTSSPGQAIKDAENLCERMATVAIRMRDAITEGLRTESGAGPLNDLLMLVREEIVAEATPEEFADMCAQTITYGLLAARVQDPLQFGASPVLDSLPLNNEFLEQLFGEVQDAVLDSNASDLSELDELYADLRVTDVESILDRFGDASAGGDPVIHFYESFLKIYDGQKRLEAGAFYTPKPVVDLIVRLVDEALKAEFGLEMGIADNGTWGEVCEKIGISVPKGVKPKDRFLSILDPATGTGTFLVSVLEQARTNLESSGMNELEREKYIGDFVLPKLKAFELMLGPYSIANFKLGLLANTSVSAENKSIYLTNTLELSDDSEDLFSKDSAISKEGERAAGLKLKEPFTVILGNPPYGIDKQRGNTGGMTLHPHPVFFHDRSLLDDFVDGMKDAGVDKKKRANLLNLYVYFWRWSIWQVIQKPIHYLDEKKPRSAKAINASPGIVAFITASSFMALDSWTGFRKYLRSVFDEILVIDLGGNARTDVGDENVFDIMTPVAIMVGLRNSQKDQDSTLCKVRHVALRGTRAHKFEAIASLGWSSGKAVPNGTFEPFETRDLSLLDSLPSVSSFFDVNSSACLPKRQWVISPSKDVIDQRWKKLLEGTFEERKSSLKEGTKKVTSFPRALFSDAKHETSIATAQENEPTPKIIEYLFRPFDRQYLLADARVIDQPSRFIKIRPQGQFWLGSGRNLRGGPSLIAFNALPDFDSANGGSQGGKDFFPFFKNDNLDINLQKAALDWATSRGSTVPECDFVSYLYGIHGSGAYFDIFKESNPSGDFWARAPLTESDSLFRGIADIGAALLNMHLDREFSNTMQVLSPFIAKPNPRISSTPSEIGYDPKTECVIFDGIPFASLPKELWAFKTNGFSVVQSWFGNRKNSPKGKKGKSPLDAITEPKWIYNAEFVKMIADVSAVIEAKKLVMPLLQQIVKELEAQPGK